MLLLEELLKGLGVVVCILLGVAYLTVAERKYLSGIQRRRGPNVVGYYGGLQAIGDGIKLILKETSIPTAGEKGLYLIAPVVSFVCSMASWSVMPIKEGVVLLDSRIGVIIVLGVSALSVYGVIVGGWSSNSRYGMMGSMRSTAQMVSYEVSMGLLVMVMVLHSGSRMSLVEISRSQEALYNGIGLWPVVGVWIVTILAETNRHPFDLPEAEAELVSGYNVEYSAGGFALYFLGEYGAIIMMSGLTVVLLIGGGGNNIWGYSVKTFGVVCIFIWARGAYPRYRYDQLMEKGWKKILPAVIGIIILEGGLVVGFG